MAVNWGLGAPVNVGGMFTQGFEHGQQVARERQTDQALAAFTQDPENPQAINALMRVNPRVGFQLYQDQRKSQKETRIRALVQKVSAGDDSVMPDLLFEAPELWARLDEKTKKQVADATSFMGQAGLEIGQLPEEKRPAAWDAYVKQGEAGGLDIPARYERYTPEAFKAAMAEAGKMAEFLTSQKLVWHQEGERPSFATNAMGIPVGSQNPYAGSVPQPQGGGGQNLPRPSTPQEAAQLPPGTQFIDPAGNIRTVPGGAGPQTPRPFP